MNPITALLHRLRPSRSTAMESAKESVAAAHRSTNFSASSSLRPLARPSSALSGVAHPALHSPDRENGLPTSLVGDDHLNALLDALRASARLGEWSRYRTLRLRMAQHQYARGEYLHSLEVLLDVWYLDLNGPRDASRIQGAHLGTESPAFEPRLGQASATVQRKVRRVASILGLSLDDVQVIFFSVAGPTYRAYHLPLPPRDAWFSIGSNLLNG